MIEIKKIVIQDCFQLIIFELIEKGGFESIDTLMEWELLESLRQNMNNHTDSSLIKQIDGAQKERCFKTLSYRKRTGRA